jgi:uncharacterized protein
MTITQPIKIYRTLNAAQEQRMSDHKASVTVNDNGEFKISEEFIDLGEKGTKLNKLVSIVPAESERVVSFAEADYLFRDLQHMNVLLTNACNLSCTYCYEQHNRDFGRFTVDSLKRAYDWLNSRNNTEKKVFQFFGGEPLIHKQLIRDFMNTHDTVLTTNYSNYRGTYVSMTTNGILLDDDFIEFYFGKAYTHMMLSLDTFDTEVDHREITQVQLDKIVNSIKKIIATVDDPNRLVIRTTFSEETAPSMGSFIDRLYEMGVRNLIVHPLVLDSRRGFIDWEESNWNLMRENIFTALTKYQDLYIKFSEGVGMKYDNNCMVGADMIAIDASGDFSGCYFFNNQKGNGADIAILGNIFEDSVYIDRYKTFQKVYADMFEAEEQCRTCDYQSACYQCPAGNLDTGSSLFRPDNMCQRIVKLYVDFQTDVVKKHFNRSVEKRFARSLELGQKVFAGEVAYFADVYFGNTAKKLEDYLALDLPDYRVVLGNWASNMKTGTFNPLDSNYAPVEIDQFFKNISKLNVDAYPQLESDFVVCFYIQCISTTIFDQTRLNEIKLSTLLA